MSRAEIPKEFEVWVCAHTKKCRWSGPHSGLVFVPDVSMMMGATRGTCPRCGDSEFFLKDSRTFKKPEPDTAQACKEWVKKYGEKHLRHLPICPQFTNDDPLRAPYLDKCDCGAESLQAILEKLKK